MIFFRGFLMSSRVCVCARRAACGCGAGLCKTVAIAAFCVHLALFSLLLPSTNHTMTPSAANGIWHVDTLMKKGKGVIGGGGVGKGKE